MTEVPAIPAHAVPVDAVLLDVREPDEWAAGHVEGAAHIPMGDLPGRLAELPSADPLHVICRSGQRSGQVVRWLQQQGVPSVNVGGGMQAWAAAGRPMVSENGTSPVVA